MNIQKVDSADERNAFLSIAQAEKGHIQSLAGAVAFCS